MNVEMQISSQVFAFSSFGLYPADLLDNTVMLRLPGRTWMQISNFLRSSHIIFHNSRTISRSYQQCEEFQFLLTNCCYFLAFGAGFPNVVLCVIVVNQVIIYPFSKEGNINLSAANKWQNQNLNLEPIYSDSWFLGRLNSIFPIHLANSINN